MTEQEKREKAIEELAQFMCETREKSCAECKGEPDVECAMWNEAVRLYDADYRKAEEVQKETAGEFYEYAVRFTDGRTEYVNIKSLKEVASKVFGVEVGE